MRTYLDLLEHVLTNGRPKTDQAGVGTVSVFGHQAIYDIAPHFPLLTTKKIHWKSVVGELLWMLRGETNIRSLLLDGVSIWSDWPWHAYMKAAR